MGGNVRGGVFWEGSVLDSRNSSLKRHMKRHEVVKEDIMCAICGKRKKVSEEVSTYHSSKETCSKESTFMFGMWSEKITIWRWRWRIHIPTHAAT